MENYRDWTNQIPESCCQEYQEYINEVPSPPCNRLGKNMNYLRTRGCYEKLTSKASSGAKILIGVGIGIAFVEVS